MSDRNPLPFPSFVVTDISTEQAQGFVDNWFKEDGEKRQKLRDALEHNERLRQLATNPFLLTILAIVAERGRELPKRRVKLYDECTAILLGQWDEARDTPRQNLFLRHQKEKALEDIALHFLERGERVFAAADLTEKLSEVLSGVEPGIPVGALLKEIVENSGILRQLSEDEYDFLHLTFHEYYAARRLKRDPDHGAVVGKHAQQDHWREVTLLLSGMVHDGTGVALAAGEANDRLGAECVRESELVCAPTILSRGKWRLRMAAAQRDDEDAMEARIELPCGILDQDANGNVRYAALEELRRIEHPAAQEIVRDTHVIDPAVLHGGEPLTFEVRGKEIVANEDGKHPGMVFVRDGSRGGFWMDLFPVTNAQFESAVKKRKRSRHRWSPHDDSPATMVEWKEASAFAKKLGKRLPKEQEWELAAAGPAGLAFP